MFRFSGSKLGGFGSNGTKGSGSVAMKNDTFDVGIEQAALVLMRQERAEDENDPETSARRARLLPGLISYVEQAPQRRRQRHLLGYGASTMAVLSAAAAAVLWLAPVANNDDNLTAHANGGELLLLRGQGQQSVAPGESTVLQVLDQVRTTEASNATLTLPTGSNVELRSSSTVQIAQINSGSYETLRLLNGSVRVKVPKLAAGEYFAVLTATSKVVVHGTRFTVDVGAGALPGTACVAVEEGLVAVHTAEEIHWIGAGESWSCRGSEPKAAPVPASEPPSPPEKTMVPPSRASLGESVSERAASVSLAEQNRLFQRALTHQRRQEWDEARVGYEELLRRYPDAPVAGEARVQLRKMRDKVAVEQEP